MVPARPRWDRLRASCRGRATDAEHVVLAELGYFGEADQLTCPIKKPVGFHGDWNYTLRAQPDTPDRG